MYYTESGGGNDRDDATSSGGVEPLGNHLYRYDLVNNELINPKLLLDLPASTPNPNTERQHMGGKVLIGLTDQNVYVGIGDVIGHRTMAENTANGPPPDGTGGILRVTQDGQTLPNSPLGNGDNTYSNLNFYYAYGMLNLKTEQGVYQNLNFKIYTHIQLFTELMELHLL